MLSSSDKTLSVVVRRMPPERAVMRSIPERHITFFSDASFCRQDIFLSSIIFLDVTPNGEPYRLLLCPYRLLLRLRIKSIIEQPELDFINPGSEISFMKSRNYYVSVLTITMPVSTITTTPYQIYHRIHRNRLHKSAREYQSTCVLMDICRKPDFEISGIEASIRPFRDRFLRRKNKLLMVKPLFILSRSVRNANPPKRRFCALQSLRRFLTVEGSKLEKGQMRPHLAFSGHLTLAVK